MLDPEKVFQFHLNAFLLAYPKGFLCLCLNGDFVERVDSCIGTLADHLIYSLYVIYFWVEYWEYYSGVQFLMLTTFFVEFNFGYLQIEELDHCPFAEICWYFTDSWEQFRINGGIDVIDGSNTDPCKLQQREKSWFSSSPKSRLQYLGPNPGLPYISEQPAQEFSLDLSSGPVDSFCLLILDPDKVDYLNLKSNERLAFSSKKSSSGERSWVQQKINP